MAVGKSAKQPSVRSVRLHRVPNAKAICGAQTTTKTKAYPGMPRVQKGQCGAVAAWTLQAAAAPAQSERQPQANHQLHTSMKKMPVTIAETANGSQRSVVLGADA